MDSVEINTIIDTNLIILEAISLLPPLRLWDCTVLAYGCQNVTNTEFSKFVKNSWITKQR